MKQQLLLVLSILLLNACASSTSNSNFRYQGIDFGPNKDVDYRKGVHDACEPIGCAYTKDLNKLKNNESYRKGWEDGLLKCKGKGRDEHLYGI